MPDPVLLGELNITDGTTIVQTEYGTGIRGQTTVGGPAGVEGWDSTPQGCWGVIGQSQAGTGVVGLSGEIDPQGLIAAVVGASPSIPGVLGYSFGENGVNGTTFNEGSSGVYGQDSSEGTGGYGVYGNSSAGTGVYGKTYADGGSAVFGCQSGVGGYGVQGLTTGGGSGVYGVRNTQSGIAGQSAGVLGDSNVTDGVTGLSSGKNGVSGITTAEGSSGVSGLDSSDGSGGYGVSAQSVLGSQLYLVPATFPGSTTKAGGTMGEILLDSGGVLWLCKGAGDWVKIA